MGKMVVPMDGSGRRLAELVASIAGRSAVAGLLVALLAAGCIGKNESHCYYRGTGEFCAASHPERPFCSVCAADFDGCVAAAPNPECAAGEASASASTVAESSSSSSASSTTSTGGSEGSSGAASGTSGTAGTSAGSTSSTTTESSSTSDGTSGSGGAICGDGMIDPPETCDGMMLDGDTCAKHPPYGGGTLKCAANCGSVDVSGCCLGQGTACSLAPGADACCPGFACKFEGLKTKCLP